MGRRDGGGGRWRWGEGTVEVGRRDGRGRRWRRGEGTVEVEAGRRDGGGIYTYSTVLVRQTISVI